MPLHLYSFVIFPMKKSCRLVKVEMREIDEILHVFYYLLVGGAQDLLLAHADASLRQC